MLRPASPSFARRPSPSTRSSAPANALGSSGASTTIAAFGAVWRGDRQVVTFGSSMRWVVDWSQPETALAALPGGQSGHPADPHYDDQVKRFLEGELHPAPWGEESIAAATVSRLHLLP